MGEREEGRPGVGRKVKIIWAFAILILVLAVFWFVIFQVNEFTLLVELEGEEHIVLEYGNQFQEPGYRAVIRGSLFDREGFQPEAAWWDVTGAVDTDTLGVCELTYTASAFGLTGTARRQVEIVDTQSPVITLVPDGVIPKDQPYTEAGYSAWDNYDGDITDRVIRLEELGQVTYAVVDSSGNAAYAHREIPYYDGTAPEITLTGGPSLAIVTGTPYSEPGYSAIDNADGDLTDQVVAEGEVLWYLSGDYRITYTVSDAAGNETVMERLVRVVPRLQPEPIEPREKTIYLTFDDGPGPYTMKLLDLLDDYGVKATFFVTDSGYDEALREIVRRGHSIGIHTVSHNYSAIYESPQAYYEDLYRMQAVIEEKTGVKTTLLRFPGGSSNTVSCKFYEGLMTILTKSVEEAGFQYFDWNIDSCDAGGAHDAKTVFRNVTDGMAAQHTGIVLQHDIHPYSVEAVEDILTWGLNNGYRFEALTPNTPGYHHNVNN